ncbi:hypothetical protein Hanom_Chr00s067219g01787521 [Helianthus anomalus]
METFISPNFTSGSATNAFPLISPPLLSPCRRRLAVVKASVAAVEKKVAIIRIGTRGRASLSLSDGTLRILYCFI